MSFRLTLTACVMLMIGLLAALLIFVQIRSLDLAVEDAATSTMDGAAHNTVSSLQLQVEMLSRMTRALAFSPSIMESSDPDDGGPVANLIKDIVQWPALDSIYVGYDNGHWLQVERLDGLDGRQRDRVGGPAGSLEQAARYVAHSRLRVRLRGWMWTASLCRAARDRQQRGQREERGQRQDRASHLA